MSFPAIVWAMNLRDVTPTAKLIAIRLGDSHDGCTSNPTLSRLAEYACTDEAGALAALEHLALAGLLTYSIADQVVSAELPVILSEGSYKPPVNNRSNCQIYVITASTRTKIGISHNAQARLESLQAWAPETLGVFWTADGPRYLIREIEAAAHAALSASRIAGEWFDVTPEEAVEAVKAEMRKRGLKI